MLSFIGDELEEDYITAHSEAEQGLLKELRDFTPK